MIVLSLAEIAAVTGGTLADAPDPHACVTGPAVSDSRQAAPGGLFAAIGGARVDGHDFATQAFTAGAACVLASRPVGGPAVIVPDVTAALGQLARHILARIKDVTVIALTGSAGKTTTKDILAQVLARHDATVATPGSFNTEIGLPLTVLRADETTRYLVLEMGARHTGDIRYLTTLTPPRVGIVLNVGSAHLGEFGSRQAVGRAKAELVQALPEASDGGIAILNADDDIVAGIHLIGGAARFTLYTPAGSAPVVLRLLGAHQVHNALAAAAAAHALDMDTSSIAAALSSAEPHSPGRLQVLRRPDGITIINDAFNANPESTAAGLRSLTADLGIGILVTVGHGLMDTLANAARTSPSQPAIHAVGDLDELLPMLRRLLRPGDVVFIKASRSVGLENFAATLQADGPTRPAG